jgi:hypothetical protein
MASQQAKDRLRDDSATAGAASGTTATADMTASGHVNDHDNSDR